MFFKKYFFEIVFIIISGFIIFLITNNKFDKTEMQTEKYRPQLEYGINVDTLQIYHDTVKKGQSLSVILNEWSIGSGIIDLLVKRSEEVFDVKKIRAGKPYAIIYPSDTSRQALYMIYEETYSSYVVFVLTDSVHVHYGQKDIKINIKKTSGVITSSLWDAIEASEAGIDLALLLSDIYAWNIDFYGLQKDDWFKAIYEEISVDNRVIATGKVLASVFFNNGKEFNAFWYLQDTLGEYFDENGQSLRRAFLKAPLKFSRISSRYSYSRMHPVLKYRRPHLGIDYAAPVGTPVNAVGEGTVISAGYSGQAGLLVKIRHNATYETAYMHLSKLAKGIKKGCRVTQGQVIGYVGSSGLSTGPHLDFRFYKNGKAIDPLKVESPPAKPVDSINMSEFLKLKDEKLIELNDVEINRGKDLYK
jgi:murein DD-endopeptidase MepM/ murein hydrolase activator NlpD